MSYFVFGDFDSIFFNEINVHKLKKKLKINKIYVHFDNEIYIDDFNEVCDMLNENSINSSHKFVITSENQTCNSSDILFPRDKYSNEELFPPGYGESVCLEMCEINLKIFQKAIYEIFEILVSKNARIFITEGYDISVNFEKNNAL